MRCLADTKYSVFPFSLEKACPSSAHCLKVKGFDTYLCHRSHHKHCTPEDPQWEIWDRRSQEHDS